MEEKKPDTGWVRYEYHVLETLRRLEEKFDNFEEKMSDHMRRDEQSHIQLDDKMQAIEKQLVIVKNDHKWYSKIVGGIWAVVAVAVSYFTK